MILILLIKLMYFNEIEAKLADEVQDLTENFFANLNADPYLISSHFSEKSVEFINHQTENYISLMIKKYVVNNHGLTKRSIQYNTDSTDNEGTYLLQGFSPLDIPIAENATDIFFIQQNNNTYSLVLKKNTTSKIILYKHDEEDFNMVFEESVGAVDRLVHYATAREIFVILRDARNVLVYTIANNALKLMQTLHLKSVSDIIIWETTNGLFLAIAREMENSTYTSSCLIYNWFGKYFDLINHEITTYGAKSISTYSIGALNFLAIANNKHDDGRTSIYSEIFKYNIDTELFESHQRILTNGAVNVQFFSLKNNGLEESYLVVANSVKDENHVQSTVNSIIYKYVDKYFIPFQSIPHRVDKWIVTMDSSDHFLLISLSKSEGIRAFTYDGWRFVEAVFESNKYFEAGITYANFQIHTNSMILKLLNQKYDDHLHLYKPIFAYKSSVTSFEDDLLKWCNQATTNTNGFNIETLQNTVLETQTITMNNTKYDQARLPRQIQIPDDDSDYSDDTYFRTIQQLHAKLEKQLTEVQKIKSNIGNYLQKTGVVRFEGEIHARNVVFNKEAFFANDVTVETINDRNSGTILDSVIDITEKMDYGDTLMNFDIVRLEHELIPKVINGEKAENLLHRSESVNFYDVNISGKAVLNHDLKVGGFVNNIKLNSNTILLVSSDQVINENVTAWNNIKINNATSNFLNNMKLDDISTESTEVVSNLDNLTVENLVVHGFLNGKDMSTLKKHALKILAADQSLENCFFEELEVENLLIKDYLSYKEIDDVVMIHTGEYDLSHKDVLFLGNLSAEKIKVKQTLNQLKIDENGDLTFLLRNISREQYVSDSKIFEQVTVINPLNLQVKINSARLKEFNPIRIIPDEEIIVKNDYNFTNNVVIESKLIDRDMRAVDLDKSLLDIIFNGLEINNPHLPYHLRFEQSLKVKDLNVSSINGIKPEDLVVNGNETIQEISGNKIIESNLHITGNTAILNINNIYIPDFEKNILRISDDQEIAGKITIQDFTTYSVDASRTRLGDHVWKDIVTSYDNERIYGTTVITTESTKINSINANITDIEGFINAYNFSALLEDTVNFNTSYIEGHKAFDNLQVENIIVTNGINLNRIKEKLEELHQTFKIKLDQVVLADSVSVGKLSVDGHLNQMKTVAFIKNWNDETPERIFHGSHNFDNVTVCEKVIILSNEINGYDFDDIVENTVKANDSFQFDDVTFKEEVSSLKPITLLGDIPGLDLENVITSTREEQILSNVIFNNNVEVIGNLTFAGLVNGMNYSNLCNFSQPYDAEPQKSLIITENSSFLNGPSVEQFQNINLDDLYEDVWLTNREMSVEGHIEFETINFENDVIVLGLVDNVNITWLANNYFSKTKNQVIPAHLDFTEGINFLSGVSAFEMQLKGLVSDLNITEFLRTTILNDVEQIFDEAIDVENCTIQNLFGDFLINNYNLPNDVMRYDVPNIITATKEVPVVITEKLSMKDKIHVQNVDILDWIHNAVSKHDSIVRGTCFFHRETHFSKGLGVVNNVNGLTFDNKNIMMKNESQIVGGKKIILSNFTEMFQDIILKGALNDIDIMKLFQNQAVKNLTNLITTEVSLNGPITTNNINVEKLYNNINVTNLISDMWISQDLNNYYENYGQLLNVANKIKESLTHRAFYLAYYNELQYFENVFDVFYLVYQGESHLAMINDLRNKIELYRWNVLKQEFVNRLEPIFLENLHKVSYLCVLNTTKDQYIYFEYRFAQNSGETIGIFTSLNDTKIVIKKLLTNDTRAIHSTLLPDKLQTCFIFTYISERYINIYCEAGSEEWIGIHQQLETYTTLEIVTFTIGPIIYIVTVEDKNEDRQNCIILWKFDVNTRLFNKHQILYITTPNSVSVATHNNIQYLAISSSYLQDTQYKGIVEIYRFNTSAENLVHWQSLHVEAPKQLQFVILPSNEFILYILTDNYIKPLQIYMYKGVSGFEQNNFFGTTLSSVYKIKQFSIRNDENFVLAWNNNRVILLQAFFTV